MIFKSFTYCFWLVIFLVTGKVEVMIRDILKEEFLKRKDTSLSIRGEYDAVCVAADRRLPMSTANQKQALVHI
jgi:hypothetical protein